MESWTPKVRRFEQGLPSSRQKQVEELLLKNRACFAKNPKAPAVAQHVEMSIDTGTARPIRMPFRWQGPTVEAEQLQIINQQLADGVISPSRSPWDW
jgi:hypothetical protein